MRKRVLGLARAAADLEHHAGVPDDGVGLGAAHLLAHDVVTGRVLDDDAARGHCPRCGGTGKMPCTHCGKGGGADATLSIGGPDPASLSSGDRAERIRQIEAQIASLQEQLEKLKFKEPSEMALRQYGSMADAER